MIAGKAWEPYISIICRRLLSLGYTEAIISNNGVVEGTKNGVWRFIGDANQLVERCTCPMECDCQDPDHGLCSNECPEHNLYPIPALTCPVHGEQSVGYAWP
jgi:hypothetical protein